MQESYYHRRVMQAIHCNMRVYKSKSEALWDGLKIGDVRTFDEIAVLGINYAYRPKTCFGVVNVSYVFKRMSTSQRRVTAVVATTPRFFMLQHDTSSVAPYLDQKSYQI